MKTWANLILEKYIVVILGWRK